MHAARRQFGRREPPSARGGVVAGPEGRLLPQGQRLPEAAAGDTQPVLSQDRERGRGE